MAANNANNNDTRACMNRHCLGRMAAMNRYRAGMWANISEVNQLSQEVAVLRMLLGRNPGRMRGQAQSQSLRHTLNERFKGLFAIMSEAGDEEAAARAAEAQACLDKLFAMVDDAKRGEDVDYEPLFAAGIKALQEQLACAKKTAEPLQCCICMEAITDKADTMLFTECFHQCHASCYLTWCRTKAPQHGDHGLRDQHGNDIPEFAGVFPRVGTDMDYKCPMGCKGHDQETWKLMLEERANAIAERGPDGSQVACPVTEGDSFIAQLRSSKQWFALSGESVLAHLLSAGHTFTPAQRQAMYLVGFLIPARLPGASRKPVDMGVCNPPEIGGHMTMLQLQLNTLTPPMRRPKELGELGCKGLTFAVSDLPEGWEWDELPSSATVRATKATKRSPGGNVAIDLTAEYVRAHHGGAAPEGEAGPSGACPNCDGQQAAEQQEPAEPVGFVPTPAELAMWAERVPVNDLQKEDDAEEVAGGVVSEVGDATDVGEETEVDEEAEEPQRNVRQRVEPASPAPVVVAADLVAPTQQDLLAQQRQVLVELRALREARERDAAEIRALRADVGYPSN
jgi:hypothetical protein